MNGHLDALKLLRRHGAKLDAKAPHGMTALMAAAYGEADCAEALLEWGADKNAADSMFGDTALHNAARFDQIEIAQLLVQHGADRTKTNNEDKTALDLAKEGGHTEIASLLERAMVPVPAPRLQFRPRLRYAGGEIVARRGVDTPHKSSSEEESAALEGMKAKVTGSARAAAEAEAVLAARRGGGLSAVGKYEGALVDEALARHKAQAELGEARARVAARAEKRIEDTQKTTQGGGKKKRKTKKKRRKTKKSQKRKTKKSQKRKSNRKARKSKPIRSKKKRKTKKRKTKK
jgi:hypothetical protein